MEALRLHAFTSTFDALIFPASMLLLRAGLARDLLLVTGGNVLAFWFPIVLALRNFGKLRRVVSDAASETNEEVTKFIRKMFVGFIN